MNPGTYHLALYRGDSYSWRIMLWDDSDKTIAVDLTGATVKAEIRDKPMGTVITTLATVLEPAFGVNAILMTLPASLWLGVGSLAGSWDLEVTFPDARVETYLAGKVTVTADVTNSTVTP